MSAFTSALGDPSSYAVVTDLLTFTVQVPNKPDTPAGTVTLFVHCAF